MIMIVERVIVLIGVLFVPAAMIVLIVWFKSRERGKRQKLQAELYSKALEKGHPIPENLFAEPFIGKKKRNPLYIGIIFIATGIGIALFIWLAYGSVPAVNLSKAASFGIIPFLIGVAYVIIHFLEEGKKNR